MGFLIGTDEAGYGPNLGPLVISTTVWQVPDGMRPEELYPRLAGAVTATARGDDGCVAIADSKALYQSGKGLRLLERGLLAALGVLGRRPTQWDALWDALAPDSTDSRRAQPWYCGYETAVPIDCEAAEVARLSLRLGEALDQAGVQLTEVRSRAIFEAEFNRLVQEHESKGAMLSRATLKLAADAMAAIPAGPILVLCDKHGGRNHYAPLLTEFFPDTFVEVRGEGRDLSVYRFGPPQRRVEIRFQAKAEAHLPAALASMASKYLRELAMRALNHFWRQRVPGLRETAGYPEDARRFKADIAAVQAQLGIEDRLLWRVK